MLTEMDEVKDVMMDDEFDVLTVSAMVHNWEWLKAP